jgi:DNA (cytosine-5)-methyltransferase 3A
MNVLSLFDGISCGRVALERANIKVDKYYSCEIDKNAIQIANKNFPQDAENRLGDVTKWREWNIDWTSIDLLIGGSPCQGFSYAGLQLNFNDPRSKLFFEYADILNHIKQFNPNVKFLLENVKMKQEYQDVISQYLGVQPIEINSSLVSAQNRKRLYWSNIPGITQPQDKGILLKDIVHEGEVDREKSFCLDANYYKGGNLEQYYNKSRRQLVFETLSEYIVPFDKTLQILDKEVLKGKVGYFNKDSQGNRVYFIHNKAITLTGESGGKAPKGTGSYLFGCITPDRVNKRQNGQRFSEGNKFYTLTAQDKHGILVEGYIRKLTPIECERLQTLPDNYTEGISNTQRYKCLGNGWTADVIAHILKGIKEV